MVLIQTYRNEAIHYLNKKFTAMNHEFMTEEDAIVYIDDKLKRDEEHRQKQQLEEQEKARLIKPFKIVLAEPAYLVKPFANIKEITNEVRIKINAEKLSVVAMCPANVAMVIFELYSSSAVEWKCEEAVVSLNAGRFYNMLKECSKNDMLTFSREEGKKECDLSFKGNLKIEYTIPYYELEERDVEMPELKYTSQTNMKMSDFKRVVSFGDAISETMRIETKDGLTTFSAKDTDSNNEFKCSVGDIREVFTKGSSNSKLSIEYLKKFPNTFFDMVTLEGGKDFPLRVGMELKDRLSLKYILAPRVDND